MSRESDDIFTPNTRGIQNNRSRDYSGKPIAEFISNGFFTVDQNWIVKYWNRAAEKITGVAATDIVGGHLWEKREQALPAKLFELLSKAFTGDMPDYFQEYRGALGPWSDVTTYHCENTLSVSFKSGNQSFSPENAEQQLKTLNQMYRLITEISNDCLWEWDLQNKEIFWIDGGHKRVFGYQIENALIPQSFWEGLLHPDDRERILKRIRRIIREEMSDIWEDEYRFKKANGEYAYVCDHGHIVYDEDKLASRMIGATQDISSRKLAESRLVDEKLAAQKELTSAILTAQQNERAEIGRSLHENLSQILCAAKLYVETARTNEDQRAVCLVKSSEYIVNVIEEMSSIHKLLGTPGIILELFDSIQRLADAVSSVNPIKVDFNHQNIYEEDLDENLQLDIFRIVQEQLSNILKYAEASYAIINLTRNCNEANLFISDNGKGCDMHKVKMGAGTMNMINRAELYQGNVEITSNSGEGYELKATLPLYGRPKELQQQLSDYEDSE